MRKLLIIAGLLIALAWIFFIPNEPTHDQIVYNDFAHRILTGQGFVDDRGLPTATWAPGYPYYLTPFYHALGYSLSTAYIANIISFFWLLGGVYTLTSLIYSRHSALLATALTALYPSLFMYNTILATETLFTALMLWSMVFGWLCFETDRNKWGWMLLCGLFIGLTTYVRPQALIFPSALFGVGIAKKTPFFATFGRVCFVSLIVAIICVPWSIRNRLELETFVITSNAGLNLWIGNHDGASGGFVAFPEGLDKNKSWEEIDILLGQQAWDWIKKNPGEFSWLAVKKMIITMKNESIAAVWNSKGIERRFGEGTLLYFKILTNLGYFLLLLATIYFLYLYCRKSAFDLRDLYLLLMLILLVVPVLIYHGDDRFHLPMIPLIIIFVSKSYDYFKKRLV